VTCCFIRYVVESWEMSKKVLVLKKYMNFYEKIVIMFLNSTIFN